MFHGGLALVKEKREGGQTHHTAPDAHHLYKIGIETDRYEGYMKHAFILDPEHGTNIAVMGNASMHLLDANYGNKHYSVNQKNVYAQLLFETNFNEHHNLSMGLSLNYDYLTHDDKETTPGVYAQYTYNLNDKIVAMAGIRADHSSRYGTFVTPRFHLKLTPNEIVSLRLSAGKGYRTVHALAENNNLLASGRQLVIDDLEQEQAWNYGISSSFYIPLFGKTLKVNAEYYHTHFSQQAVVDYDSNSSLIRITNLDGKSYSNTVQVDATLQLNGGGRMPTPVNGLWDERFKAYEQVSAQITRWFRHFSVYIGGENLTGFRQKKTIISAEDPWSPLFDTTMVWGPVHGAMFYAGVRVNIGRL